MDRAWHKMVLLSPPNHTDRWLAGTYFGILGHTTNQLTVFDLAH
jgi:hypothetical protein